MSATFAVEKMHCDACARRITKAIEKAAPGAKIAVDVAAGRVTVDSQVAPAALAAAITAAGYPARPFTAS